MVVLAAWRRLLLAALKLANSRIHSDEFEPRATYVGFVKALVMLWYRDTEVREYKACTRSYKGHVQTCSSTTRLVELVALAQPVRARALYKYLSRGASYELDKTVQDTA